MSNYANTFAGHVAAKCLAARLTQNTVDNGGGTFRSEWCDKISCDVVLSDIEPACRCERHHGPAPCHSLQHGLPERLYTPGATRRFQDTRSKYL